MPMTMPMVAPFFVQDSEYQSMVTMVNEIASTVHATLIVRSMDGTELGRKVIAFPPHSRIVQNLSSILGADTPQRIMGSIELDPNPAEVTSMGIAAQLSAARTTIPAASLEEEFLMVDMSMPSSFRAVVPSTFKSTSVAMFNTGDMPEHATVACSTEAGANFSTLVTLAPHQMVLNGACDRKAEQNTLAIDQDLANPRNSRSAAAISVTTDGMPGSLAVWGMAQLGEGNGPIALNFTNSSALKTAETIFAGVPIGSADLLPGHSFKPALAVANFSGSPRNVTVSYNTMLSGAPSTTKVSTLQLQPMSVRQVTLSDLASDPALKNSFVITSDGAPGDVISNLIVLGGDGMQPVQLIGKDSQVNNGGGHPWNIDQGDRATVFLFNRSSSEELFNVNIVANGTRWHQEYSLKPAETKSIDIYKIVGDQEADKKGKKLPANATSGEVSWFTVDPGKGSGRVLISNAQSGLARNFSCGYNLVLCGSFLYNSVATFGISADGYLGAISDYTCTAWANNACSGQQYDSGNGGYSYSWRSNSTGIAPITGSTTNSSGEFYGQAGGTGTGTGQLNSSYCQSQSTGQNNVQVPTSLSVLSKKALPQTSKYGFGCFPGQYGFQIDIVYQVLDQKGTPIKSASMEPQEQDLNYVFDGQNEGNPLPTWGDIMGGSSGITAGRKNTDSNGTFEDAPFGVCASAPFTATYTQPISVLLNNQRFTVRTNNWSQTGTGPATGQTTNGTDISITQ
jgi:hypothetical protein